MSEKIILIVFLGLLTIVARSQNSDSDSLQTKLLNPAEVISRGPHKYIDTIPSQSLRMNVPLIELPQNIAVINSDAMKDFGVFQLTDVLRLTGGVTKTYGRNNDVTFNYRGFNSYNNFFRNGIGYYWWNQQSDAFMLDKIELVKGPAGFMIANSEPGGMINETTKQADGIRIRDVEIGVGSFNLYRVGIDIGDKFSKQSKWSYRAVVGGQYTEMFFDFYKSHRLFLVSSIRYTYKNNSNIQVECNVMNGHFKGDSYLNVSYNCKDQLLPYKFNSCDPNAFSGAQTNDNYIRISNNQHFKNGWNLNSQIGTVWGIWKGDAMDPVRINPTFDTVYRQYGFSDWANSMNVAQVYFDRKFYTGSKIMHSLLMGVEYENTLIAVHWSEYAPDNWGNNLPLAIFNPQYNLTSEEINSDTVISPEYRWRTIWYSALVLDQIKFFEKLILTLGGRYTYTELTQSWDSTTVYDTRFTPRIGLSYLFKKNLSLYIIHDETFLPQSGKMLNGTAPKPQTGTSNEFGFKALLCRERLSINSSLFQIIKNNVLVNIPQTDFYEERGQITSDGFELGLMGNVNANIIVNANYAFINARITKDADSSIVGYPAFGVPKHSGNVTFRYRFLKGKLNGLSAGVGAQYVGEKNAADPAYTDVTDKNKRGRAYCLFDANAGYEYRKLSINLNMFNILNNKKYFELPVWQSANSTYEKGFYYGTSTPINFRVTAAYRF